MMFNMNNINSFNLFIKQSDENMRKVIPALRQALSEGINPMDAINEIFAKYHISGDDFTDADIQKIENVIKEF